MGQSIDIVERWNQAYKWFKCKSQPKIYNALIKYGYESFDKIILEQCSQTDWILDYREMHWVRVLDSMNNGYNCTIGGPKGHNFKGRKHSPETIEKMRMAKLGKRKGPMPEQQKEMLSKILKGRVIGKRGPMPDDMKQKIKDGHSYRIGSHFKHTEEAKAKIREARSRQIMRSKKPTLVSV